MALVVERAITVCVTQARQRMGCGTSCSGRSMGGKETKEMLRIQSFYLLSVGIMGSFLQILRIISWRAYSLCRENICDAF